MMPLGISTAAGLPSSSATWSLQVGHLSPAPPPVWERVGFRGLLNPVGELPQPRGLSLVAVPGEVAGSGELSGVSASGEGLSHSDPPVSEPT